MVSSRNDCLPSELIKLLEGLQLFVISSIDDEIIHHSLGVAICLFLMINASDDV